MPSFTKKAINQSFLKLLDERPLSQITVKDVVEDCGISRNAFYYHYADLPALLDEILRERTDQIIARYGSVTTLEDCLNAVAQFAKENKRAFLHAYRSVNRDYVEDYLMRICRYTVERFIEAAVGDGPILEEDREIMLRFFQCECFGQAVSWLNRGMDYDLEAQFSRLGCLMQGMPEELVRRCAEEAKKHNI